jgi:alpha-tubulin suppressor-like RCC1 family protein
VTTLAAGEDHSCALVSDGTVQCWGNNENGQLGDGTTTPSPVPVLVRGMTSATSVAAGMGDTCATLESGTVQCWGKNFDFAHGRQSPSLVPATVEGLAHVQAVSMGLQHKCALEKKGAVRCWRDNASGESSHGTGFERGLEFAPVEGTTGATAVAAGYYHTCALVSGGVAKCWSMQLGNATAAASRQPASAIIADVTGISSRGYRDCAVVKAGAVHCWGKDSAPVRIDGIANAVAVTSGMSHACALLADGRVACWGGNGRGQLGNGTTENSLEPVVVSGLANATAISAGWDHTCALRRSGDVWCWGRNDHGQLGNGTTEDSLVPVGVSGRKAIPSMCEGSWPKVFGSALPEQTVRQWLESRGVGVPDPLPTCHDVLHLPGDQALLCSRRQMVEGAYGVVIAEVLGVRGDQLEPWFSLPVAAGTLTDRSCKTEPAIQHLLVQLDLMAHSQGEAIIVRELQDASCMDSHQQLTDAELRGVISPETYAKQRTLMEQLCMSRGVYVWRNQRLEIARDGVIPVKPEAGARSSGVRLPGPCVDPYGHALAHHDGQVFLQDYAARDVPVDLDMDGDGTQDRVIQGDAIAWHVTYMLYVVRGQCAYFLGSVTAAEVPRALPHKTNGLHDLHTADYECPPTGYCDTLWRFNGTRYVRYRDTPTRRVPAGVRP